ncbi:MAG: peptidylprolyl isomerase [Flavobacteriales bacterium]|jgi:cyclophilin family peptidyl-prolyl cis-trans isomerase|nr:peptidylprolyl isomerase [Flavobacteriales bacterium]
MLQTSSLKLFILTVVITSFSACGLLKKSNKAEKTEETVVEKAEEVKEEVEEVKVTLPQIIEMNTTMGKVVIRLYEKTQEHRKNFAKLIEQNYYDGLLFHRVIKDFMIQGGDPNSKNAPAGTRLGNGGPNYTIPAEIMQQYFHKKGALCAARQGDNINPEQRSSGSQFYIVTGAVYSMSDLKQMEARINQQAKANLLNKYWKDPKNKAAADLYARYNRERKMDSLTLLRTKTQKKLEENYVPYQFNEEQIKAYTTIGGTPFLDNGYTVFGEVLEGIEIVEKIGNTETLGERPVEDIKIVNIKIIK